MPRKEYLPIASGHCARHLPGHLQEPDLQVNHGSALGQHILQGKRIYVQVYKAKDLKIIA